MCEKNDIEQSHYNQNIVQTVSSKMWRQLNMNVEIWSLE